MGNGVAGAWAALLGSLKHLTSLCLWGLPGPLLRGDQHRGAVPGHTRGWCDNPVPRAPSCSPRTPSTQRLSVGLGSGLASSRTSNPKASGRTVMPNLVKTL